MKSIVIYFSKSGHTEELAKRIAADLGGDLLKINAQGAQAPDLSGYDAVFFGYPIYAGSTPKAALSFMEGCDLKGKTLIPFSTARITKISKTLPKVEKACSGAKVRHPLGTTRYVKGDSYDAWLTIVANELKA